MIQSLFDTLSSADQLLALSPEELGRIILSVLSPQFSDGVDRWVLVNELTGHSRDHSVVEAVAEAVNWLETVGLVGRRGAWQEGRVPSRPCQSTSNREPKTKRAG